MGRTFLVATGGRHAGRYTAAATVDGTAVNPDPHVVDETPTAAATGGPFGIGAACHHGVAVLPRHILCDEPTDGERVSEPETDYLDGRQRQHVFADGGRFGNGRGKAQRRHVHVPIG
jgi:ABC-type phosphonate transport system ATPase subunit